MNNSRPVLGPLQYAVIVLTVLTALIHLVLGMGFFQDMLGKLFVLNGVGYLALLAALYFLPQFAGQRALVRWALMAFAGVTIVAWLVMNGDFGDMTALATKVIEVALIVALYLDSRS